MPENTEKVTQSKGRPANVVLLVKGSDGITRALGFQPKALRECLKTGNRIPVDPGSRGLVVAGEGVVEGSEIVVSGDVSALKDALTPKGGEMEPSEKAALKSENSQLKAMVEAMAAALQKAGITV